MEALRKLVAYKLFDTAIVVAAVTGLAYLLTYLREAVYLSYFGVGSESVRVQLEGVIFATFAIGVLTTSSLVALYLYIKKSDESNSIWRRQLWGYGLFVLFAILFMYPMLYIASPDHAFFLTIVYLLAPVIIGSLLALPAVIVGLSLLGVMRLFNKARASRVLKWMDLKKPPDIIKMFSVAYPLFILMAFLVFTFFVGRSEAAGREQFKQLVFQNENVLIVREYGNHSIAMKYDQDKNILLPNYYYLKNEDLGKGYKILSKKPILDDSLKIRTKQTNELNESYKFINNSIKFLPW
jgi:hypothetical protein